MLAAAALIWGCGGGTNRHPDAAQDAVDADGGSDSGDAGLDAGGDAADAGDSGIDAGGDAGGDPLDAGGEETDADTDGGGDTEFDGADAGQDAGGDGGSVTTPCVRATDCGAEDACNFSTGRCEPRAVDRGDLPRFLFLHPLAAATGDFLILDGDGYFGFFPNPSSRLQVGSSSFNLTSMEIDQNRLLIVRDSGCNGSAQYTSSSGSATWDSPPVVTDPGLGSLQSCLPGDPVASGSTPAEAMYAGPYAAAFADSGRNGGLRVFYPAECGGLRRPPAAGAFPVVLILHGDGAVTINYEFLARHLASWGFVSVMPVSAEVSDLRSILGDALGAPEVFFSGLAGHSAGGSAAVVGHSRGAERTSLVFKDGETRLGAAILLGPCSADSLYPVPGMVFAASGDLQSLPIDYQYNYSQLQLPRYFIYLKGGNHSQFTDHRHWEGLAGGDLMPTMTRNRQFELVQSFVLAFLQRHFGQPEFFPQWLDNPGLADEIDFEKETP